MFAHSPQPGPLPDADNTPLDLIFIEGFCGHTVIGIDDGELHAPQPLHIDVHAGVSRAKACDTDQIGDTIHYGLVRQRLQRLLAEHRVQLLEALAQNIADILLTEFGALWVRVRVVKPNKFDDVQALGVQIERRAEPVQKQSSSLTSRSQPAAAVLRLIGSGMVPPAQPSAPT